MALTDNLVAYYKLDESSGNAADATGNGFTLTNNNTVSYATGLINNGADLGTSNTNKTLATSTSLGITTGDFTVSFWYKNDGTDREFDGQVSIGTGSYSMIFFRNGTNNRWFLATSGGGNTLITESITNSTWYFLTMVKSGGTVTVYVNATSKGSTSTLGSSAGVHFTVGGFPDYGWYGTNKIDEVGVWSRALSGAEITSLYNGGSGFAYPFGAVSNSSNFFMLL